MYTSRCWWYRKKYIYMYWTWMVTQIPYAFLTPRVYCRPWFTDQLIIISNNIDSFIITVSSMNIFFKNKAKSTYLPSIILISNASLTLKPKENWMEFIGVGVYMLTLLVLNTLVPSDCSTRTRFKVCGAFLVALSFFCSFSHCWSGIPTMLRIIQWLILRKLIMTVLGL